MKQLRTAQLVVCLLIIPFIGFGISLVIVMTQRINVMSEWYYAPGVHNDSNFHPSNSSSGEESTQLLSSDENARFMRDTFMQSLNYSNNVYLMPIALPRAAYAYSSAYEHGLFSMTAMILVGISKL